MQSFDEAYAAKVTLENKREIEARGGIVPEAAPVGPKFHRCQVILDSYLKHLRSTTKRNGRAYRESAIKARESDIRAFVEFTKRTYVEQISEDDFKRYWEHLKVLGRKNETVINKFTSVTSWLRNNQVVKIINILDPADWPMHDKPVARLEWSDLNPIMGSISVDSKMVRTANPTSGGKQRQPPASVTLRLARI